MKRIVLALTILLGFVTIAHADGLLAPCAGLFCQGPSSLTSNTPILGNGGGQPVSGTRSGNTTVFATSTGTLTNGHCVSIDGSGNCVDAGGACTTGGGGGTVSSGTSGQMTYYAATGTTVSGNANATISSGAVTLGQAGSVLGTLSLSGSTSGTTTLSPAVAASGTLTLPAATDTLVGRITTDTLTNKTISGSSNTLTNIGNASLTNSSTTVNGQTCTLGSTCTVTAAATGVTIGTTTITTGTSNGLLYDNAGVIGNLASANSGVLVTSGAGAPSISAILPNGLALGTPGSVTLTNGTGLPIAGITGLGTGIGTWLGTPSSANLAAAITDETGNGALVFGTSPALSGTISGTPTWASGINIASGQTYKINGTQINCAALSDAGSGCSAQQNVPYWRVYRSTDQSLSTGVNAQIAFNAASYDAASVCNLSTGACSPQIAGLYYITCQVRNSAATGPAAGNNALSDAEIKLNGTIIAQNYQATQVSSLTSPVSTSTVSSTVKLNGTTDTVTCATQIDGTTPVAASGTAVTFMTGYRTGAQ